MSCGTSQVWFWPRGPRRWTLMESCECWSSIFSKFIKCDKYVPEAWDKPLRTIPCPFQYRPIEYLQRQCSGDPYWKIVCTKTLKRVFWSRMWRMWRTGIKWCCPIASVATQLYIVYGLGYPWPNDYSFGHWSHSCDHFMCCKESRDDYISKKRRNNFAILVQNVIINGSMVKKSCKCSWDEGISQRVVGSCMSFSISSCSSRISRSLAVAVQTLSQVTDRISRQFSVVTAVDRAASSWAGDTMVATSSERTKYTATLVGWRESQPVAMCLTSGMWII